MELNSAGTPSLAEIAKTIRPLTFPTRFAVEVTAECNLECAMCHYPNMQRPKGRMPFELWRRCANQIAAISPDTQCWFSFCGEPLLEPEMLETSSGRCSSSLRALQCETVAWDGLPHLCTGAAETLQDSSGRLSAAAGGSLKWTRNLGPAQVSGHRSPAGATDLAPGAARP